MNKMKRLLIVTQAVDQEDSALGFFCEWLEAFAADAHIKSVEVWCLRNGKWDTKPSNVTVKTLPKGSMGRIFSFLRLLFSNRFDAIFVHMTPIWVVLGGAWWRLTRQRLLLWYTHGTKTRMLSLAVKFANAVCTATPDAFPIKTPKLMAIGHGIGIGFAKVSRETRDDCENGLLFISVGRISERKSVKETIAFFAKIKAVCPVARFTWIGEPLTISDERYFEEVRDEINKLKLQNCVAFHGRVSYRDMPNIYSDAGCLIHLSKTGSLDKVVIEAMAAGCPVLSTNPATKEVLPDAYWNGSLDEDSASEVIRRAQLGVSPESRATINQQFSLTALIGRLVNVAFTV